jgi:DNA-binding CsgD family transcriptional regulator
MGLRPGTVKTFLRLVMTKMAVPTRSAVMARLVELSRPADRLHLR